MSKATELAKIIGKNIQMLRHEKDLKQSTLAKKSKLSQSTIAQIERALKLPSVTTLELIANALKVLPYQLLKEQFYKESNDKAK
jgi:transcriptional regulator with XRE-family HTH domain